MLHGLYLVRQGNETVLYMYDTALKVMKTGKSEQCVKFIREGGVICNIVEVNGHIEYEPSNILITYNGLKGNTNNTEEVGMNVFNNNLNNCNGQFCKNHYWVVGINFKHDVVKLVGWRGHEKIVDIRNLSNIVVMNAHIEYNNYLYTVYFRNTPIETFNYKVKAETKELADSVRLMGVGYTISKVGNRLMIDDASKLVNLDVPRGVRTIDKGDCDLYNLESLRIPNTITRFERGQFGRCEKLTYISMENNTKVKSIGSGFIFDSQLESIVIPEGIVTLGDNCIWNNKRLKEIKLPSTIRSIGKHLVGGSSYIKIVIPQGCQVLHRSVFSEVVNCDIHVPKHLQGSLAGTYGNTKNRMFYY